VNPEQEIQMPDISIISPSLNSANVITDCIGSVQEQGDNIEHLVIDGHSTDGSLEIIQSTGGANLRVLQQPPAGIYSAINAGILAASGEIIGILHADDFYAMPDVLKQVATAFEDPSIESCYGDLCYVDAENPSRIVRYWRAGEFHVSSFRNGWMPPHPTFFVRRQVYEALGLYRTDLGTAADYELMVRLLVKHRIKTEYIPNVLVKMRTGGSSNVTWRARLQANRNDRRAWKVNGLNPYPWTTLAKPLRKIGQWWNRP
jgi:glycosyltransferase